MLDEQPNTVVCAIFVPVMFLAGRTGLLFRELAGAMVAAIAFSGFVALSLAAMLFLNSGRKNATGSLNGSMTGSSGLSIASAASARHSEALANLSS